MNNAAGALADGGCGDVAEIARLGLKVASRTVTPRTGKGRLRIVSRGEAITCGRVCVCPDDLIVMDDTGMVLVPQDKILAVLTAAEDLDRRDAGFAERLKTDGRFARAAASLKHA
ncbi:hypothetical protein [Bradyrhizobium sp. B120]|uniref:RraA family protein n=1 Tax=Bradyrhizobium sp. B120 TaxID=3410088 RepID=UPI003B983F21